MFQQPGGPQKVLRMYLGSLEEGDSRVEFLFPFRRSAKRKKPKEEEKKINPNRDEGSK